MLVCYPIAYEESVSMLFCYSYLSTRTSTSQLEGYVSVTP